MNTMPSWKTQPRGPEGRWIEMGSRVQALDGGFTFDPAAGEFVDSGFALAVPDSEERRIPGAATPEQIQQYAEDNAGLLSRSGMHLGAWREGDETVLDVSEVQQEGNAALADATQRGEEAIFDLNEGVEIRTLADDWEEKLVSGKGEDIEGLPGAKNGIKVPGRGRFHFGSNKALQDIEAEYKAQHPDWTSPSPRDYSPVDLAIGAKVAKAYEDMEHNPQAPQVQEAYSQMKAETMDQYNLLREHGYEYEFYPSGIDPYPNSPREAIYDLTQNKHMFVFPTDEGFGDEGSSLDDSDNPLLEKVPGVQWGGRDVTYNDVFRAVHDTFGHGKEGVGFRGRGEDNAYRQHSAMYSPTATNALASETRGQNQWLNYGPYGETNRTASLEDTVFADQKAGILPEWAVDPDLHKEKDVDMSSIITPSCVGPYDLSKTEGDGRLAFWKQIVPKREVHYTAADGSRRAINFDAKYLADLANQKAVDHLGFLLADKNNAHTMDPERWRGDVDTLEVREDGLYGRIVFPTAEAASAVLNNPDLGVSARIRPENSPEGGGIVHVLGTLDPQADGMGPWEPADLSIEGSDSDVLDLSSKEYTMPDTKIAPKKSLGDYTDADIDAMDEGQLDAFLEEFAPQFNVYTGDRGEDDNTPTGESTDMSNSGQESIDLANERVASANSRADEALRRVAEAEWNTEREGLLSEGVPTHMLDLAAPVLNRADDMVIDLSNESEDVNVSEVVRGLLAEMKGTVDLSTEAGHGGSLANGEEDPDKDLLGRMAKQGL